MRINQSRGTPGLMLLIFAGALLLTAAAAWKLRREHRAETRAIPLTGLGDARHYTRLSDDDLHTPALVFPGAPRGLFRRSMDPVRHDDATMRCLELENTGRFMVYIDIAPPATESPGGPDPRWYLKAADNLYVEFGEQKYHPAFEQGR